MKLKGKHFNHFFFTIIMSLFLLLNNPYFVSSYELVDWYHGATGYEGALIISNEDKTPIILFFYLDSNEFCRRLMDEYLKTYEFETFSTEIPKVEVNLDGNQFEKEIAAQYKVENEPTLIVAFPFGETEPMKISPFLRDSDMSVEEFVQNIRNIVVLAYSDMGYDFFESEDYEAAVEYFSLSVKYDPEKAYTYFALGSAYHALAVEEISKALFKKAEENYSRALKIDPEFKECLEELDKLHENIKKLNLK